MSKNMRDPAATAKKRGPTALGRTLVDKEVGEGSGGRGGHVKDEQEGGEVRDLGEEERARRTKTYKGACIGGEGRGREWS